jgi:lipid-binding SYLF domain-containing protein
MTHLPRRVWLAAAMAATLSIAATPAWADRFTDTISDFRNAQASAKFFDNAHGYAVFPRIAKGGVGLGGAYGKGRVYQKGRYIGDVTMTQLSIGFQLGGQGFSQMIFFETAEALKSFTDREFELGAEASAVAITLGATAKAGSGGATAGASVDNTKATLVGAYNNGLAVFTIIRGGLMYEVSLAGQKFKFKKR